MDGGRWPGWRALAGFWLVVILVLGGGAGVLAWLGPPPAPPRVAAAPAPVAAPAPPPAAIPPRPPAAALPPPVPDPVPPMVEPDLVENTAWGLLPRSAPDGRSPMLVYSRPFDQRDGRPRVALIVGGLGMNASLSEQAIASLPPAAALAFNPYANFARPLIEQARNRGFETLLALPLEPTGFPLNDPGDRALLTVLPMGENLNRLEWLLARFPGHAGAVGALGPMRGERFAAAAEPYGAMQDVLGRRGLLYFDPRPGAAAPTRAIGRGADLVVDEPATRGEIEAKLAQLERIARERGSALGYVGEASPVAVARIAAWAAALDGRGIALAPPSALVRIPLPGAPSR